MALFPQLGPKYYSEKDKGILTKMEAFYSESITINPLILVALKVEVGQYMTFRNIPMIPDDDIRNEILMVRGIPLNASAFVHADSVFFDDAKVPGSDITAITQYRLTDGLSS